MEHEVFVPFPAGRLREALADPVRVARAVPGLQQDASAVADSAAETDGGSPPGSGSGQDAAGGSAAAGRGRDAGVARVAGRLKVRVAGHTITYRGAFRVSAQADGSYAVEGDATEVRGAGAVKLALTLRLLPAEGGTTLAFGGTASGDGRLAELPHDAVTSTGARLLTRFGEALSTDLASRTGSEPGTGAEPAQGAAESGHRAESETGPSAGNVPAAGSEREPAPAPEAEAEPEVEAEPEAGLGPEAGPETETGLGPETDAEGEAVPGFEADVTSSPFDSSGEDDEFGGKDFVAEAEAEAREPGRADAMAEAAHARRTMIGRSAEEVDHAPPRGRYAPVPPPEATAARDTLRWAAPAAALALASAIVVTRALRKRR
ncbi:carbon monoxide dehydrogenase [Streptomyces sp. NBC_00328]|uniref:carbon monoxide dehydrogenase n=1 Tax=Streptomyces sp. NBC_00328 TaxID=2903646 RepID=UPI002E2C6737|nr:carbon monoxide dehydrogenase [Streptomyces sp. NBC_00328]